jgi:hypothetical protein
MSKLDELRARYPLVEIEEKDGHLRIYDGHGTSGGNIADEDLEERIAFYNIKQAVKNYLEAQYPYLYFGSGDIPGFSEPGRTLGHSSMSVWLRRLYDYGPKFGGVKCTDGTSTGFSFLFPPDVEATKKLIELNAEAKQAQQDGYFFCTGCQKAKVKEEYVGYWFASVLCNSCATPEWKRRAAAETYE